VEFDHADIYADMSAVTLAFRRLVNLVPRKGLLLLGADSEAALALKAAAVSRVQTFGTAPGSEWQAFDLEPAGQSTRFQVRRSGSPFGTFDVPLVGTHNVRNALAAIAVAAEAGLTSDQIARSLRRFTGVKRRLEVVGTAAGVTVYDDFAHHPTAVAETLAGLRASSPGARIWAVFEPRSATSCRRVFQGDFGLRSPKQTRSCSRPSFAPRFRSASGSRFPIWCAGCGWKARRRVKRPQSTRSSSSSSTSIDLETWSSSCRMVVSAAFTSSCFRRSSR
jgi:hypothetical protein